jgi:hypothetical protein
MTRYKTPLLTSLIGGDPGGKVAMFLLGGFAQKQITQALFKARTVSSL